MKLCVVMDDGTVYAEFNTRDFKRILKEEFNHTQDVERAFERVQERLKIVVSHK